MLEVVGVSPGAFTGLGDELLVAATKGEIDGGVLIVFEGVKDAIALGTPGLSYLIPRYDLPKLGVNAVTIGSDVSDGVGSCARAVTSERSCVKVLTAGGWPQADEDGIDGGIDADGAEGGG